MMFAGLSLGSLELVTIVFQIQLGTGTVALVYGVGRLLFADSTSALLARGLAAIEPLSILYTSMLLSEVLFTFLVTLSLYLMLRAMGDGRWRGVIFAAAVIAAATFVRAVSYFLPLGIGAIMLLLTFIGKEIEMRLG